MAINVPDECEATGDCPPAPEYILLGGSGHLSHDFGGLEFASGSTTPVITIPLQLSWDATVRYVDEVYAKTQRCPAARARGGRWGSGSWV